MILGRGLFWILVALLAAQPANACRGVFSERYLLLETPPSRLPPGAVLLQVHVPETAFNSYAAPRGWHTSAKILDGPERRLHGATVRIEQDGFSSCDRGAETSAAKYVVGFLGERRGELTLLPVLYRSKRYRTEAEDRSDGIRPPIRRHVE